jgi:tetraacyldisaccharide 4'-kinase
VSIGNLHWGGGGKTPLVAALAAHLLGRGLRPAILSRGYGSQGDGVRFVSLGQGPILGAREAGDEPVLLASAVPEVPVVVGHDRVAAGRTALGRLDPSPNVFLLDDGFSHLRLHRDLDLLVFPAADPFAGGRLPPAGRLREPLDSARHADAVVLTGAQGGGQNGEDLAAALLPWGFAGRGFTSFTEIRMPRQPDGSTLPPGACVFAVAAVARPGPFFDAVAAQGFRIAGQMTFRDHFAYPDAALRSIAERWREAGADFVVTTAKDAVKLRGRLAVPYATLDIVANPEPAFWDWLDARLEAGLADRLGLTAGQPRP